MIGRRWELANTPTDTIQYIYAIIFLYIHNYIFYMHISEHIHIIYVFFIYIIYIYTYTLHIYITYIRIGCEVHLAAGRCAWNLRENGLSKSGFSWWCQLWFYHPPNWLVNIGVNYGKLM